MAIAAPFPAASAHVRSTRPDRARVAAAPVHRVTAGSGVGSWSGMRLTRRGRIAVVALSSLFLLMVVLLSGRLSADAGTSMADQGRATGVVVVQAGENLWQIAKAIAPGTDPRETVTLIRELNALDSSTVVAGQSILVPVMASAGR